MGEKNLHLNVGVSSALALSSRVRKIAFCFVQSESFRLHLSKTSKIISKSNKLFLLIVK